MLDLSEAPPPASNGTCASIPWSAPDYTEKFYEWESLLAAHQTPDGAALALTVLVVLFIVLCAASAGAPVASKDEKEAKATRDAQLIALRMVAVVGLVVAAAVAVVLGYLALNRFRSQSRASEQASAADAEDIKLEAAFSDAADEMAAAEPSTGQKQAAP